MPEFDEDEDSEDKKIPPPVPDCLLDSWLLRHFPGRFLDEIYDEMDIFRFLRAIQAQNIESIEKLRTQHREKKVKTEDITSEQWDDIRQHDELFNSLLADLANSD